MPEFCLVELLTWRIHCMRVFVLSRTFSCSSPDNWKAWRTLKAHSSTDTSTCWRCVTELLWLTCSTGALVTVNWIWSQVVWSKYSEEFNLSFYKICGVVLCCAVLSWLFNCNSGVCGVVCCDIKYQEVYTWLLQWRLVHHRTVRNSHLDIGYFFCWRLCSVCGCYL